MPRPVAAWVVIRASWPAPIMPTTGTVRRGAAVAPGGAVAAVSA
jgi:hypothetical protein